MEEELKEKIADIIDREDKNSFALPCMDIANQILTLIREAGWRSPEECTQCIYDLQGIGARAEELGIPEWAAERERMEKE